MKAWALLVTAFLVAAVAGGMAIEQDPPTVLDIHPDVQTRLNVFAAGMHLELNLCLLGYVAGDTAYAVEVYAPVPFRASASRSSSGACPSGRTVAFWHNHPGMWITAPDPRCVVALDRTPYCAGAEVHIALNPTAFCALSAQDRRTGAELRYPFLAVSVSPTVHCWWSLAQAAADTTELAMAVPGQASWLPTQ